MNHQQTGKVLPGRPHGFTDQMPTSLQCPFLQENKEPDELCLYSWLNFCCYCCCFLCFCGQNKPELIKKERAQSSRQLRSNSAARPLAEVTKKHHQQKGKHTFGQGSPQLAQCWETHAKGCVCCSVSPQLRPRAVWRRPCCCLPPIPGVHRPGIGPLCLLPLTSQVNNCHLLTGCLGFKMVHSCVDLKRCSPHIHSSGPFCEGIKKKNWWRDPPSTFPDAWF